jgi:tetratricopeptide (TPR) repeat protein
LEEAKREAKQAAVHYQLGRFSQAADAYAHSYELVPTAGLLFNLGQCQMMLKDYAKAIFFFEGYLRDKADAPNAALARDLITEAKRDQAAEQALKDQAEAEARAAAKPAPPPPPPPAPVPRHDRRRVPAIALGASGIALVAAALYLGQRSDAAADLSRLVLSGSTQHKAYDAEHRHYLIAAAVTGGVGAAAAVASGVLGYLGWRKPYFVAAPIAGGGAVSFAGSF